MNLLKIIKNTVLLAPCRCGRTFYRCDIVESSSTITAKFTPSDEFLEIDPRREDEDSMPAHFKSFEKWEHVGLAVGSIEYMLNEVGIKYTVEKSMLDQSITLFIENTQDDIEYSLEKQQVLKHAQRSFDLDTPVDSETLTELTSVIDQFLSERSGHKIMVTDPAIRKKLYALSIYWNTTGEQFPVKAPQTNAPLIISVPPTEFSEEYYLDMGRLYSTISLTAIKRGYKIGFCNAFDYMDPRIERIQDTLQLKWGEYTIDNVVPRSFIGIGKEFDATKPYNWVNLNDSVLPSCILVTNSFVNISTEEAEVV